MNQSNCVFCKIIQGTIPASLVAENNACFVIKDIAPKAAIHYLFISKKHIPNLSSLDMSQDSAVISQIVELVQKVAGDQGIQDYRLVINTGAQAGQTVFHLHVHLLAGGRLPGMMSDLL